MTTLRATVSISLAFLVVLGACGDDFPTETEQPSTVAQPANGQWPDSLPVNLGGEDPLGIDTLEVTISSGDLTISGIDVEWVSDDPEVVQVTEIPSTNGDLEESLSVQLRAEVRARSRGTAAVTARVLGGRGVEPSEITSTITVVERWSQVSAGGSHTCAVASDGFAYCWGNGQLGELGNGQFSDTDVPVAVLGDIRFQAVTAGNMHSCGLDAGGFLHCWGLNLAGQLGDGTTVVRTRPVQVSFGQGFVDAGAGMGVTCGIATDGYTYCWGSIDQGIDAATAPAVNVGDLSVDCPRDVSAFLFDPEALIAPGGEQCLTVPSFRVHYLHLQGDGNCCPREGFVQLSVGREHACAVGSPSDELGTAQCWGLNVTEQVGADSIVFWGFLPGDYNKYNLCPAPGRLADLEGIRCMRPASNVVGNLDFVQVSAGLDGPGWGRYHDVASTGIAHSCGVTSTGEAYCWGADSSGELGSSSASLATCSFGSAGISPYEMGLFFSGPLTTVPCATIPALVDSPPGGAVNWVAVAAGWKHSCALTTEGEAYCWGANDLGQLGTGSGAGTGPALVAGDLRFKSLSAGANHACGISQPDEAMYCWGESFGDVPSRVPDPSPRAVP